MQAHQQRRDVQRFVDQAQAKIWEQKVNPAVQGDYGISCLSRIRHRFQDDAEVLRMFYEQFIKILVHWVSACANLLAGKYVGPECLYYCKAEDVNALDLLKLPKAQWSVDKAAQAFFETCLINEVVQLILSMIASSYGAFKTKCKEASLEEQLSCTSFKVWREGMLKASTVLTAECATYPNVPPGLSTLRRRPWMRQRCQRSCFNKSAYIFKSHVLQAVSIKVRACLSRELQM
eukprot:1136674-Pelagomonas_calceolata.AAC.7